MVLPVVLGHGFGVCRGWLGIRWEVWANCFVFAAKRSAAVTDLIEVSETRSETEIIFMKGQRRDMEQEEYQLQVGSGRSLRATGGFGFSCYDIIHGLLLVCLGRFR